VRLAPLALVACTLGVTLTSPALADEKIRWQSCDPEPLQCGSLSVPLD
jgi:hypothetical protein